jgi:hypothetical protein
MAHFAVLDGSNSVTAVNVIADADCLDGESESEAVGIAFCEALPTASDSLSPSKQSASAITLTAVTELLPSSTAKCAISISFNFEIYI